MKSIPFPLIPGEPDVEFRFSIKAARDLERAVGCSHAAMLGRGQFVEAIVQMVCYGLRHSHKKMTDEMSAELVSNYIDAGGTMAALSEALFKAMSQSGVYGHSTVEADGGESERPTTSQEEVTA